MRYQTPHNHICDELMADISTSPDAQQFKYGGKELDRSFGLDLYDFHARQQDAKLGRFNSVDPLAEKYYGISPYAYCAGDPVNLIDPTGMYPCWNGQSGEKTAYYDSETGNAVSWEQVQNWIHYGNYEGSQSQDKSSNESSHTITPFGMGIEWLTGVGERHRTFVDGDYFTEKLREHEHIRRVKKEIAKQIKKGHLSSKGKGGFEYGLNGVQGVWKYIKDYSTLSTFGLTSNLAVTYLGSYNLQWSVIKIEGNTAIVLFDVNNASTIESGTRPPIIGYTSAWKNTVGRSLNNYFSSGAMSKTTQQFVWTEKIELK